MGVLSMNVARVLAQRRSQCLLITTKSRQVHGFLQPTANAAGARQSQPLTLNPSPYSGMLKGRKYPLPTTLRW
jgi:hypothetical protein